MKKTTIIAVVFLAIIGLLGGGWYNSTRGSHLNALDVGSGQLGTMAAAMPLPLTNTKTAADIVEQAGPAVVCIEAVSSAAIQDPRLHLYGLGLPEQAQHAAGTGFIIDTSGYILTNQHVVDGALQVTVKVQDHDYPYPAAIVGEDRDLDLAILKIEAVGLPTLALGDSDLMRSGDQVIAIGNPLGLDHTVTTGVVSAKGRPITVGDRNYTNLIQTDAAINSGNSGGPLINMAGQAIAINTAISTQGQGIGFAIPINTAKQKVEELINTGKVAHPFLGIGMTELTDVVRNRLGVGADVRGVVVARVENGSAAGSAGVEVQDVITAIDGLAMAKPADIKTYIEKLAVGQRIRMEIVRDGRDLILAAVLGTRP